MPAYIKVSGAYKTIDAASKCYVKVGGVWKACNQVYVKVNGAWKPCFSTYTSKTLSNAVGIGKTITLNNVQVGSTITISGTITSPLAWDASNVGGQVRSSGKPFYVEVAQVTLTGATLSSSSGNGSISGTFMQFNMGGEVNSYTTYSYGIPASSLTFGPQGGNYTLKIKATSATVKITVNLIKYEITGYPSKHLTMSGTITYTGS